MTTPTHNTNPDQKFSREFILGQLKKGQAFIRFTKVSNGEDRIMRGTLNPDLIRAFLGEQDQTLEKESTRKMVETSIRVFDMDKSDWRTVNVATVYHVGDKP